MTRDQRKKKYKTITHALLLEHMHYCPRSGVFTRIKLLHKERLGVVPQTKTSYGYYRVSFGYRMYLAHRLAWFYMTGKWPAHTIDHKNSDRADNRWKNLREATVTQNVRNRIGTGSSGFKGVCRYNRTDLKRPWYSRLVVAGKLYRFGPFLTAEEAYSAYCQASKKYHGKYSNVRHVQKDRKDCKVTISEMA